MKKQFWKFYNIFVMKVSCCKDSWINWIVDVWQSQPIICSCLIMIHVSDTCHHSLVSLPDKHSAGSHNSSPTLIPEVGVKPYQSQQLLYCSYHPAAGSLASDLDDCNRMKIIWQTNKENYFHYHIEWLWQKSRAEIICLMNLLASLGVSLPFLTR